jgi:hypothetical protein
MANRAKIIHLFGQATRREKAGTGSWAFNLLIFIAVAVLAAVVFSSLSSHYSDELATAERRASEARDRAAASERQAKALQDKMEDIRQTQIFAGWLDIRDIRILHMNGEIFISGEIRNTGPRAFNDIELTVYCLSKGGTPLYEERFMTESSDGKPLTKGQRRRFDLRIENAPPEAKEAHIVISDIQLAQGAGS